jgi:hypothetical protein
MVFAVPAIVLAAGAFGKLTASPHDIVWHRFGRRRHAGLDGSKLVLGRQQTETPWGSADLDTAVVTDAAGGRIAVSPASFARPDAVVDLLWRALISGSITADEPTRAALDSLRGQWPPRS